MKRFIAFAIAAVMVLSLCGCNGGTPADNISGGGDIEWGTLADTDITGAWKLADGEHPEYYIFTADCKLRVASGSAYSEAQIQYGKDGDGVASAYSQGYTLYGQWVYTVDGDKLTIVYPEDENGDVLGYELVRVTYEQVTLDVDKSFKPVDALVGYWYNEEYDDSYEFTADGFAKYVLDDKYDDNSDVFIYKSVVDYTYKATDSTVTFTYIDAERKVASMDAEYTIEGDKLTIDGNDYFRTDKASVK